MIPCGRVSQNQTCLPQGFPPLPRLPFLTVQGEHGPRELVAVGSFGERLVIQEKWARLGDEWKKEELDNKEPFLHNFPET